MIFGSVCSGIEAASVAWHPLGWRCAFMSEIEPFPRAVLAHHYPETKCHGDFTTIQAGEYEPIDVLVGGTPCQSFSVAGLRGGMEDARGNLALEYLRLADRLRPRWVVWENVPGVRSSSGGRDFGAFLGGLGQLGYGWAYRSLDAQYFGLAQRRERVFVVGCLGDWRRAAAVLFEPASLRGDPAPGREAGQGVASTLTGGSDTERNHGKRSGSDRDTLVAYADIARCLNAHPNGSDGESETFIAEVAPVHVVNGNSTPETMTDCAFPLRADDGSGNRQVIASTLRASHGATWRGDGCDNLVAHALRADGFDTSEDGTGRGTPLVASFNWQSGGDCRGLDPRPTTMALTKDQTPAITGSAVRRLTPGECEKLQGFPVGYTDVPFRGKPAADGNRYKALGNSMAVPVMRWIGQRIAAEDGA